MKRRKTMSTHSNKLRSKKRRQRLVSKLESAPPVNSIRDLIEIGKSIRFYKNLDTVMLWRITPYLEQLDAMIGMKSLKESVFYQTIYYLKGMHTLNKNDEYLHTLIMGPPGHGKCMGKDTPVIMQDGTTKMIQNIKPGDQIMGDDSTPRNVLSICTGKEMMYKVHQTYGDNYIVNESHIISLKLSKSPKIKDRISKNSFQVIWFTKDKTNSKTFSYSSRKDKDISYQEAVKFLETLPPKGTVIDINILEYLKRPKSWKAAYKGFKVGVDFPEQNVDLDPYILGIWLADVSSNGETITSADKEVISYFNEFCIKKDNDITYRFNSGKQESLSDRNTFVNSLKKYNLIKNKHIPYDYKINSESNRLSLLAGLIDSDGYLYDNCYEIIQKNEKLATDILFLTRSLGFRADMKECEKSCLYNDLKREGTYYQITINGNIDKIPVLLSRKKASVRKQIKNQLVYGINIEKLEVDDYYGFEIDGNHRFLLGDFTVTHNTEVAKIIGKIYQAMGILSRSGPFKIAYRDDFVAEYLGQTAVKTRKLLDSCIGGILFVDELYSLGPGVKDRDSFSKEALDTLTGFLSEHKNDFCFIGAGYEEDIKRCFMGGNKGLERRFQWIHKIDKYTPEELSDITIKMIGEMKWQIGMDKKDIVEIIKKEMDLFKHAGGDVETFISKMKMVHAKRVFSLDPEHMFVFTKQDITNAIELIKKNLLNKEEDKGLLLSMYM